MRWWHFVVTAAAGALVFLVVQSLYEKVTKKPCTDCAEKIDAVRLFGDSDSSVFQASGMGGKKNM